MTLADFTEPNLLIPELLNERQESAIAELSRRLKDAGRVKNAREFTSAALNHESPVSTVFDEIAFSLARGPAATRDMRNDLARFQPAPASRVLDAQFQKRLQQTAADEE
jgi:hypothetical protein